MAMNRPLISDNAVSWRKYAEQLEHLKEKVGEECHFARDAKAQARIEAGKTTGEGHMFEIGRAAAFAEMSDRLYRLYQCRVFSND